MKKFTSKSQQKGEIGENVACAHLIRKGFEILERNYTRKWGEIDIVAQKANITHFIEVKSVTREIIDVKQPLKQAYISRGTSEIARNGLTDQYRPEDQMHTQKQKRLKRTIATYLAQAHTAHGGTGCDDQYNWQFDVICVYLDMEKRRGRVKMLDDIILG